MAELQGSLQIQYLEVFESRTLQAELDRAEIDYVVNKHRPNTGKFKSSYLEIKVRPEHYSRAEPIAEEFRALQKSKAQQCPECKAFAPEPLQKPTFFQRIYYAGTTLVRCKECKTVYAI